MPSIPTSTTPDRLAIDVVISPEREVAEAALQRLAAPATFDTEMFMGGRAQLLGIQLSEDCPVLNTPLRQLNELFPTLRAIVVGVRREGHLFAPDPGDQLAARGSDLCLHQYRGRQPLPGNLWQEEPESRSAWSSSAAATSALAWPARWKPAPTASAPRSSRKTAPTAERAADALERTIVLHGDGMDMDLLMEASDRPGRCRAGGDR